MESPAAAKYVDGVAYHWYEDYLAKASSLSDVHNSHPSLFHLPTEVGAYFCFASSLTTVFRLALGTSHFWGV